MKKKQREPKKKSLHIFDFDGTLFNTADPTTGRAFYQQQLSAVWPHRSFLSHPDSLCHPFPCIPGPALVDCRRAVADRDSGGHTEVLIISGRRRSCLSAMKDMLRVNGIQADHFLVRDNDSHTNLHRAIGVILLARSKTCFNKPSGLHTYES